MLPPRLRRGSGLFVISIVVVIIIIILGVWVVLVYIILLLELCSHSTLVYRISLPLPQHHRG